MKYIRAAENEYSNKFLLQKGSSLFCDRSELEFLSFCLMRHSWRPRDVKNKKVEKVTYIGGVGGVGVGILLCEQLSYIRKNVTLH